MVSLPRPSATPSDDIVMLFLGGAHQLFHLAPVAAELSRIAPQRKVTCIASNRHVASLIEEVRERMNAPTLRIETVEPPAWWHRFAMSMHRPRLSKLALLIRLAPRLARAKVIVTPERTSAWLRKIGLRVPMIHFRHGAGDRAPKSEQALKAFDLIVVPGEKDVRRAIESHHIDATRIRTGGYVKLDYLGRRPAGPERLFDNDRPVIIYNAHFDRACSSWHVAERVVELILADGRYNLVVAPHIRLAEKLGQAERARWLAKADPARLIVDFHSDRLIDMSYIRSADLYLGDMSSQLYEFLARPRPVAFINAHGVDWRNDARYAGWHLGRVAEKPDDLLPAIDAAFARHRDMVWAQRRATARAFGTIKGACERAATILAQAVAIQDERETAPPLRRTPVVS